MPDRGYCFTNDATFAAAPTLLTKCHTWQMATVPTFLTSNWDYHDRGKTETGS